MNTPAIDSMATAMDTGLIDYNATGRWTFEDSDSVMTYSINGSDSFKFLLSPDNDKAFYYFYRFSNNKWKLIGKDRFTFNIHWEFADLNFDGVDEVIVSTGRNMNGNTFKKVYAYNSSKDKMVLSGELCDELILGKLNGEIYEDYEGSWYMTARRTIYKWNGLYLYEDRSISCGLRDASGDSTDRLVIKYYETSPSKPTTAKLMWQQIEDQSEETEADSVWANFWCLYPKDLQSPPFDCRK
jgi:hypothetical protein